MPKSVEPAAGEPVAAMAAAGGAGDLAAGRPRRMPEETGERKNGFLGWGILIVVLAVLATAGYLGRDRIIAAWPPAIGLYDLLGISVTNANRVGLELRNVASRVTVERGVEVLSVSGEIANVTDHPVTVPRLRVTLQDEDYREIHYWTTRIAERELAPSQSVEFATSMNDRPADTRHLTVTFEADAGPAIKRGREVARARRADNADAGPEC